MRNRNGDATAILMDTVRKTQRNRQKFRDTFSVCLADSYMGRRCKNAERTKRGRKIERECFLRRGQYGKRHREGERKVMERR